jgi:hypothetical protein
MTEPTEDRELKYANKILNLMNKAESTTPEEAEALMEAAQRLMTKHAITEAVLAHVEGRDTADHIVQRVITFSGIYNRMLFDIGQYVALVNDCKALYVPGGKTTDMYVIGYSSDVARVEALTASLQIQCFRALKTWWKDQPKDVVRYMSGMQKFKDKREFIRGFGLGLSVKLSNAKKAGREEAESDIVKQTQRDAASISTSTDLILRTKESDVQDWMDVQYGTRLRNVTRSYAFGRRGARSSGFTAGSQADIGQNSVGGTQGAIGR